MFKKIIVLLVLITSIVLSQGWNDIKPTNISLANANYAEMFSNSFGNNVILQNTNGSISYYIINASNSMKLIKCSYNRRLQPLHCYVIPLVLHSLRKNCAVTLRGVEGSFPKNYILGRL